MLCSICKNQTDLACEKCAQRFCSVRCQDNQQHRYICGLEDSFDEFVNNRNNFDEFVTENMRRLDILQTYPINTNALQDWMIACIHSTPDANIHAFAQTFAANLRHISFFQLRDRIYKVCQELRKRIESTKQPLVVLLLGDSYRKSSTWISMLAWHALRDLVSLAVKRVSQLPESFWDAPNPIIIHADDMAYSGSQLAYAIGESKHLLLENSRVQYLLLLPFISTTAKGRLADEVPMARIPEAAEHIKNFEEQLTEAGHNAGEVLAALMHDPWKQLYGVEGAHSLVYFDHKLADSVSIPNKMLAGPTVLNSATGQVEVYKIISNCEDAIYRSDTGQLLRWNTYVFDFANNFTCPVAFYKLIEYTWQGRKVTSAPKYLLLDILD